MSSPSGMLLRGGLSLPVQCRDQEWGESSELPSEFGQMPQGAPMSRSKRRAGTKTKVIPPGFNDGRPSPQYKWPRRTKYHPRNTQQ